MTSLKMFNEILRNDVALQSVYSVWPSDPIYKTYNGVNIGSGNGLMPDATKSLL